MRGIAPLELQAPLAEEVGRAGLTHNVLLGHLPEAAASSDDGSSGTRPSFAMRYA